MKKTLYHGSKDIIDFPVYEKGNVRNDYGLGFYCTENLELALEWAVAKNRDGYANEYEIEMDGLKVLNLNDKKYHDLYWLNILIHNRVFDSSEPVSFDAIAYLRDNFSIPYREYDIIIGYRADDSYFAFAQDFISNTLSYQQLGRALKLGNLGEQVVLISEKAFSQLSFVKTHKAKAAIYFDKKDKRDREARKQYFESRKGKRNKGELYVSQILDEEIKDGDPRL